MKKDLGIIFGLFLVVVALLAFGRAFTSVGFVGKGEGNSETGPVRRQEGTVSLGVRTLTVDAKVAEKADERKKGLSSIDSLPLGGGMLFVFDKKGSYAFWMKDVKFAIDIIWIGEDKKIVDIANSLPPEPGKDDDELTLYRPREEALYALEINAGLAALHGLAVGDQVNFEL